MSSQQGQKQKGRLPARQHLSMPSDSRMPRQAIDPPFFDFASENTEVISAAGFFGAGHLHRLGTASPYHATIPTASATSASASGQVNFSYRQPSTTRVRSREPPTVSSEPFQPGFPVVTTAYSSFQQTPTASSTFEGDWPQPQIYNSDASPAPSSLSNASYTAHGTNTDPYMGDYIPAQSMDQDTMSSTPQQPGFEYYPWPAPGDGTMGLALSPSSADSLASPILPAGGGFPEQGDSIIYGGGGGEPEGYSQSLQQPLADTMATSSSSRSPSFVPHNPAAPTTSSSSNKPKLRSASRTSKNLQIRPDETPRERKSRNSHNLVEKQYRNRLNLHFESLMNALPESMKNSVESGGSGGVSGGVSGAASEGLDLGERRLSKAQVLDMSTRYIKSLEKDRENLERENGELVRGMERLRELLAKEEDEKRGVGGGGGGGGGRGGGFDGYGPRGGRSGRGGGYAES